MAIPDRFRLLSKFYVEREVNEETYRYYANSPRVAARMAPLISKLFGHMTTLLASSERDQAKVIEDFESPQGEKMAKTHIEAINPDLAKLRSDQRQKAVEGAVQALLDEKNRYALCEMLVDSLREDFPRKVVPEDVQALSDGMDVPTFMEHMRGLAAANAKVFGDLGNALGRAVRAKATDLLGADEGGESWETDG